MFDASTERVPDPRYRGMNPNFVKSVWEKRRQEKSQRQKPGPKPKPVKKAEPQVLLVEKIQVPSAEQIISLFRIIVPGEGVVSKPKAKDIIKRVCWENEVDVASIIGGSKNRHVTRIRQLAIAEVRRLRPDMMLSEIGRLFNRDHTTVIYSLRKMGCWHGEQQAA